MAISNSTDRFNGVVAALAIKAPCAAVAIANLTLSGEQTVNGVAVVAGNRVLVIAQTSSVDNGIYDVSSSAWKRSPDFDGNRDIVKGTIITISIAIAGLNPGYKVTTSNPIVIGTTAINFSRIDGRGITTVGDKSTSLTVGTSKETLQYTTTLTANRTVTLSTAKAVEGDRFRVVRTALGAFTLDVGGLKTIPSATAAFVDVEFNGSAWVLTGYGVL